jgi:hypothetical protein
MLEPKVLNLGESVSYTPGDPFESASESLVIVIDIDSLRRRVCIVV